MEQKNETKQQIIKSDSNRSDLNTCLIQLSEILSQLTGVLEQLERIFPIAQCAEQDEAKLCDEKSIESNEAKDVCGSAKDCSERDSEEQLSNNEEAVSDFLFSQLKTSHYRNWLEVASCEKATWKHLEAAARLCITIKNNDYYHEAIAEAIAQHPAANDRALLPLCQSTRYVILLIVARSEHAGVKSLLELARQTVNIKNSDSYQIEIAEAIAQNPATNDTILCTLADSILYEVWKIAASSSRAGERTLTKLSHKCATISNNDDYAESIALAISTNPNATDASLKPLCETKYFTVWTIVAESPYAGTETLSGLARKCAATTKDSRFAYEAARTVADHPNCTIKILSLMGGARLEKVSSIAHTKMHSLAE